MKGTHRAARSRASARSLSAFLMNMLGVIQFRMSSEEHTGDTTDIATSAFYDTSSHPSSPNSSRPRCFVAPFCCAARLQKNKAGVRTVSRLANQLNLAIGMHLVVTLVCTVDGEGGGKMIPA